jgi:hypothetical protein
MAEPRWHWRNCRDIGVSIGVFPLTWRFGIEKDFDVYGGSCVLSFGPLYVELHANIGNPSSDNRFEAWRGLSLEEAWERARRFEGGANG